MSISQMIAKNFSDFHFGGNWTVSNLKDQLADVSWEVALKKDEDTNSIAQLTYHIHYFVHVLRGVLEGGPLVGKDSESFDHPPINSQSDWEAFLQMVWDDATKVSELISELDDSILEQPFAGGKYGTYHRNLMGVIEHGHYHLGQIALIKKKYV